MAETVQALTHLPQPMHFLESHLMLFFFLSQDKALVGQATIPSQAEALSQILKLIIIGIIEI
jgi:hypothetical protein